MRYLLTLTALAISLLGFSQSEYPMLLKIDTTTVCAFTIDQVDSINVMSVNLDECLVVKDSLNKEIRQHETREARFATFVNEQDKKIDLQFKVNQELIGQNSAYEKQSKKDRRKIKFLKFQRNGLAVAVFAAVVKIFILR